MPVVTRDEFGRRTSDSRFVGLHRPTTGPRQERLLVVTFNGTLAGGLWSSRETLVPAFAKLISPQENVFPIHLHGVGTDGSWSDYFKGGIGGWGTLRNVVNALSNLSSSYYPGDRIILIGYSRGAWAARLLAKLISVIGLPRHGNGNLFKSIYETCENDTIWNPRVAAGLLNGYECWANVRIDALCCFDTVGSLGIPLTTVTKPFLRLLRLCHKKRDIISDVAPNVDFAFHALSLNEEREPYDPTLMRGPAVVQVLFPGVHGDLGWIEELEGLVQAPLAWMAQQLHTHLGIKLDEGELRKRFPKYRAEGADEPIWSDNATWYKSKMKRSNFIEMAVMGRKVRKPGRINRPNNCTTDLMVHIGANLRANSRVGKEDVVPGYTLTMPSNQSTEPVEPPYWCRDETRSSSWGSWRSRSSKSSRGSHSSSEKSPVRRATMRTAALSQPAARIEQAPVGLLEARCLGLPLSYVTNAL